MNYITLQRFFRKYLSLYLFRGWLKVVSLWQLIELCTDLFGCCWQMILLGLAVQARRQGVFTLPGNPPFAWKGAGLNACELARLRTYANNYVLL